MRTLFVSWLVSLYLVADVTGWILHANGQLRLQFKRFEWRYPPVVNLTGLALQALRAEFTPSDISHCESEGDNYIQSSTLKVCHISEQWQAHLLDFSLHFMFPSPLLLQAQGFQRLNTSTQSSFTVIPTGHLHVIFIPSRPPPDIEIGRQDTKRKSISGEARHCKATLCRKQLELWGDIN